MPFVKGIDVSVYDPVVNWAKIRSQGFRFAMIRASFGVDNNQTVADTMFQSHWAGARVAGLLRGPYHYLKASQDGTKQAIRFLEIVNWQRGDLPPALDLEEVNNENATNQQFITNAEAFLKKVKNELGVTPMVYSRASFLQQKVSQPNGKAPLWARDFRMWVAHWTFGFGESIHPIEMPGWSPYMLWQYSGERDFLDGITNEFGAPVKADLDVFRGTLEELFALADATAPLATTYTVKQDDTLENIARRFNISLAELVSANLQILTAGTKLTIPQPAGATGDQPPDPGDTTDVDDTGPVSTSTYTVKPGDTLTAIALRFNSSVKAIAAASHIADPNLIVVGQVLVIPKL